MIGLLKRESRERKHCEVLQIKISPCLIPLDFNAVFHSKLEVGNSQLGGRNYILSAFQSSSEIQREKR